MTHLTLEGWHALWQALGAPAGEPLLFSRLIARYSEQHRHYHTLAHLRECMAYWDAASTLAQRPAEVEIALWFHDAIHDPRRHDNEQQSADWAQQALLQAGVSTLAAQRVHALVMATRHEAVPADPDARLLVDIDLAILGAAPARFDEYESQVRAEYAHVPPAKFDTGRSALLAGLLARPQLYGTEQFRAALEAPARANLRRSIARLQGG